MFRLSFLHTLSIRTWQALTYWYTGKQKLFSYSERKKTRFIVNLNPNIITFYKLSFSYLHRHSFTFLTNNTILHYLTYLFLSFSNGHHFITLFLSIITHFKIWPIFLFAIHFLPNFSCTFCPPKLLTHTSTNHLHYFRNS